MRIPLGTRVIEVGLNTGGICYSVSKNSDELWNQNIKPKLDDLRELVECVSEKRSKLLTAYNRWSNFIGKLKKFLKLAEEKISNHLKNSNRAEAVGSSLSAAGSAVAVAGFALALPTAGVSLGLVIGGTVASAVGGTIATGSSITGTLLRKRIKNQAEKEHDVFKTRTEKLQLRCDEYIQSLNEFFQLYYTAILPCIENSPLLLKYFSREQNSIILSPVGLTEIMLTLSEKKGSTCDVELLKRVKELVRLDPCLYSTHAEFSRTDFCHTDSDNETATCSPEIVEKCLKNLKTAVGLIKTGSVTPTFAAKIVDMSGDVVSTFAKGATLAGRVVSITLGSVSLGIDIILVGNAFRKLYKGSTSENLEKVRELYKEVENAETKALEALRPLKLQDSQSCVNEDKNTSFPTTSHG